MRKILRCIGAVADDGGAGHVGCQGDGDRGRFGGVKQVLTLGDKHHVLSRVACSLGVGATLQAKGKCGSF
jgi:hypothetical protein